MFLKRGISNSSEPHSQRASLSISSRLTAHYLISAFVILSICMILLYWGISQSLRNDSIMYMKDEIRSIETYLLNGETEQLSHKILSAGKKEYAKLYVRIVGKGNKILIETPSMGNLLPAIAFHPPVPYNSASLQDFSKLKLGGKTYISETLWFPMLGEPQTLQIALDISNLEHVLIDYQVKIIVTLIIGVLLSALAGSYIARKGLRPLTEIAEKTRQITASKLGERFISEKWPVELSTLAASLDAMLDRLQDSFERLRSYAANLAHELRTPIANLMGEAEIALGRNRSCEEYERIIESSLEEYQRLTRIVESMLFLAWADSREVEMKFEEILVNDEIHNLHDYYEEYAHGKAFMILCDPGVVVWADATLLRRALSNLIMNAIKYSPEGGVITIEVIKKPEAVEISVTDQGHGISKEHKERLFDRFYRVPGPASAATKGSGLGLSIVRSIMILHGGNVYVESELGKGTKVILNFPEKKQ